MSVRTEVADLVTAGVPADWTVKPFGFIPDKAWPPVVAVQQTAVTPRARFSQRTVRVLVTLMLEGDAPDKVEDALEAALDVLLAALDPLSGAIGEADRVTVADRFHAYQVTVEVTANLET